jgi:hypothetical protein
MRLERPVAAAAGSQTVTLSAVKLTLTAAISRPNIAATSLAIAAAAVLKSDIEPARLNVTWRSEVGSSATPKSEVGRALGGTDIGKLDRVGGALPVGALLGSTVGVLLGACVGFTVGVLLGMRVGVVVGGGVAEVG